MKNKQKYFIIILCLLSVLIYGGSLRNGFVFDDNALIVNNPFIKSIKLLPQIFKSGLFDHWQGEGLYDRMYRPLQVLSYWLDYHVWRLNPAGFRLTNIFLHLFNTLLLYYLLSRIFIKSRIPAFTSLLFLAHPFNAGVVFYISSRADLLSSFFIILSLIVFLKYLRGSCRRHVFYGLSILSACLALFCRENSLIIFMFITLILLMEKAKRIKYVLIIPFIFINISYLSLRAYIFGKSGLFMHGDFLSLPLKLANFFNIIFRYLWNLLLPSESYLLRSTPFVYRFLSIDGLAILILTILAAVIFAKLRNRKAVFFGCLWFVIGIFPVFFLFDGFRMLGRALMAESWVYLASAGFFVVLTGALLKFKFLGKVILASFVIFYSFLSIAGSVYWKNNLLLHKKVFAHNPQAIPVRKDLIDDYLDFGMHKQALDEVKRFASDYPFSAFTDIIRGNYYFATKQFNQAVSSYSLSLSKTGRGNFFLYYRLSLCYKMLERIPSAIDYGVKCFNANPYFEDNLISLGELFNRNNQPIQAAKFYQLAKELNPNLHAE